MRIAPSTRSVVLQDSRQSRDSVRACKLATSKVRSDVRLGRWASPACWQFGVWGLGCGVQGLGFRANMELQEQSDLMSVCARRPHPLVSISLTGRISSQNARMIASTWLFESRRYLMYQGLGQRERELIRNCCITRRNFTRWLQAKDWMQY